MLPGTGAIILLAGDDTNDLVYVGEVSLFAQFASARRMYPGTDMAVIAKMRQLFREAERRQEVEKQYAANPAGIPRPPYDPTHYALFPVIDGDRPVFFHTEDVLDVHRALSLQEELGFGVVLSGLNQSFDAIEKLKAAGIPLMITLDLPEDKDKPQRGNRARRPDATDDRPSDAAQDLPNVSQPDYDPLLRVNDFNDLEAEKKNLEARRSATRKKYLENARSLAEEGVAFGFTTIDTKANDILPNVRTLIENGLSEEAALAALTTNPAQILGVSATMGTIEEGKMGNLVITTGNVFENKTHIRYVFIDGRKHEFETTSTRSDTSAAVSAAGTWTFTVTTPDGEEEGTIVVNDDLTGTIMSNAVGEAELFNVSLEGNTFSFSFDVEMLGTVSVTATITGDELAGDASTASAGSFFISAERTATPEQ